MFSSNNIKKLIVWLKSPSNCKIIQKLVIFWLEITIFDLRGNSRYAVFCGRFQSRLNVYLGDRLYLRIRICREPRNSGTDCTQFVPWPSSTQLGHVSDPVKKSVGIVRALFVRAARIIRIEHICNKKFGTFGRRCCDIK